MTAHRVIVSCCVKCIKFQTVLKTCVWHSLDVKCSNTVDDDFTFTKEEIFIGCYPNDFDEMASESGSEFEETIDFPGKIFRKSCFTHSKLDFERSCSVCQKNLEKTLSVVFLFLVE